MGEEEYGLEVLQGVGTSIGVFDFTGDVVEMKFLNDGYYQMVGQARGDRTKFFGIGTLGAILAEKAIEVVVAGDGKAGLEQFVESAPGYFDAILMDVHMPLMDGYEATRRIRLFEKKDAHRIPIIAMTADAFADDVQKALDAGMNGHIAKPIDLRALIQALLSFLS